MTMERTKSVDATPSGRAGAPPARHPGEDTTPAVRRFHTTPGEEPLQGVEWTRRDARILNPDGSVVFEMQGVEVPSTWSQLATDIMASKYFRKAGVPETGSERSSREVVTRVARTLRKAGEELGGYFADPGEAQTFEDELTYLLIHQYGAFNSPVWFNCGLSQYHGIQGRPVGSWHWDRPSDTVIPSPDAYTRPQLSACFIQSIQDDLMDIADQVRREMLLFKFGSGTGTNFSSLRAEGERLSGGGTSSGLMSFLEILDRAAGATKSGGTTRRAAKMVILDMDHPDIERFIRWKAREEDKALALIQAGYDPDFNGEAYRTVSGQNSNNSVRISDSFMSAVIEDRDWATTWRTTGEVAKVYRARELMHTIARAAWRCADPGVQFDTTINRWHTCKNSGEINASNPCSEYMFLDNSACNLASLNLMRFTDPQGRFQVEAYRHAITLFTTAMEIVVDFASYPTREIAANSHDYRPLGLGYANLGTLLMTSGIPYDSDEGRNVAAALSAILCGRSYATSAAIAARKGPFPGFDRNREPMLEVMRMHRDAAYAIDGLGVQEDLAEAARTDWDLAVALGEEHGYRNAQATVIAPTGTIGLLMDCDTTGVEPDFALVKFKKLAGGGYFKLINQSVPLALRRLGYDDEQVGDILRYVVGTQSLDGATPIRRSELLERGLTGEEIGRVEKALPGAFDLKQAFSPQVLGDQALARLGLEQGAAGGDVLDVLGYGAEAITASEVEICGRMTVEKAPHLRAEHLAVFDCANRCGRIGTRFISHLGHIRMMAAVQPFISGAISKTINMPGDVTVQDIEEAYFTAWKLGLKAVALYRDGCKVSQPLQSTSGETTKTPVEKTASGNGKRVPQNGETASVVPRERAGAAAAGEPAAGPGVAAPRPGGVLERRRLPKKRRGFTQEARVGGNKVYLRTGEYPDGRLGEIFLDMHKEGAAFRSIMNCFAIAVSLGLQHGVPLEEYVDAFVFTRFDPQGPVDHPNIKYATSVIDYIFRVLGMEYLDRTDFVQLKPADQDEEEERVVEALASGRDTPSPAPVATAGAQPSDDTLDVHLKTLMGDAPFCDGCGHLTVRNGACYKCLNCGNSMGCS